MEKDLKELLLKDLCGRLPYGVKCLYFDAEGNKRIDLLNAVFPNDGRILVGKCSIDYSDSDILGVSPYLFPLSSMNEEQKEELVRKRLGYYQVFEGVGRRFFFERGYEVYEWLNEHHFDYRGLIVKFLVLDATNLNIYRR